MAYRKYEETLLYSSYLWGGCGLQSGCTDTILVPIIRHPMQLCAAIFINVFISTTEALCLPICHVQPPAVCDFQEVFFSIEIYRNEGTESVYKQPKRRIPNGQKIEAKITSGLQANIIYNGSITFSDTSSQYMMLFSFGKCLKIIF